MKLLYSPSSPFAAKVRMAARHCGLALECIPVDTAAEPPDLLAANPLGKIPALILNDGDGDGLYDSRVICDYFDRRSGGALVPRSDAAWMLARRTEATADGTTDAAILTLYEVRHRPESARHQPWIDKQWRKASRGLDVLDATVPLLPREPGIGHFALAGLLGWMELRFEGRWQEKRPRLAEWLPAFAETFPAYDELKPRA